MAEQNTGDTKPSLARRGARPFAGPSGAPGVARPGLRPPAPGQRPAPAPFGGSTRSTLGGASASPAAAKAVQEGEQASGPVAPAAEGLGSAVSPVAAAPNDIVQWPDPTAQPIPSEMVALDAIDAFDALWASAGDTATHAADNTGAQHAESSRLLDQSSLGELDAGSMWSDDIVGEMAEPPSVAAEPSAADQHAADQQAIPSWLADDPTPVGAIVDPHAYGASESNGDTPDSGASVVANSPRYEQSGTSASLEAEPQEQMATVEGASLGAARPRFELIEDAAPAVAPAEPEADEPRRLQVSAALTRLAERVRAGEIDVTSIAPDATDAAVLAAVLAALLGGSRSR